MAPPAAPLPRSVLTIPSSDQAFAEHVAAMSAVHPDMTAHEFEATLRSLFPRVVVRERSLSGEAPAWYVYRDGSWRPVATGPWWLEEGIPQVTMSSEGWVVGTNRAAADLLDISTSADPPHHFTDFVVPGALENALSLFRAVGMGSELDVTVLLRPMSGEVIAVDLHAARDTDHSLVTFRLATDIDIPASPTRIEARPMLSFVPATDVAFRLYVERALGRMPEPTTSGLELRIRRLYPHATVVAEGEHWSVRRDRDDAAESGAKWWLEPGVARARYDAQALILEANEAATQLFGRELVGHYWQEFVTAGSTEEVALMLEILGEIGAAESRFRLPMPDGALLEFDSYTEGDGEEFESAYRVVPRSAPA